MFAEFELLTGRYLSKNTLRIPKTGTNILYAKEMHVLRRFLIMPESVPFPHLTMQDPTATCPNLGSWRTDMTTHKLANLFGENQS